MDKCRTQTAVLLFAAGLLAWQPCRMSTTGRLLVTAGKLAEPRRQRRRRHAFFLVLPEQLLDVGEQQDPDRAFVEVLGEGERRVARQRRPAAAGNIGDREQGLPVVLRTIVERVKAARAASASASRRCPRPSASLGAAASGTVARRRP